MSETDLRVDIGSWDRSDQGVRTYLPTGTVTLLVADFEGWARLWETQPQELTAALHRLDRALPNIVAAHDGVLSLDQGALYSDGQTDKPESFLAAFAHATDAVACAVALQQAPLVPIRLRIGLHTGEVQMGDMGNYIGPTLKRAGRLRELAHGGQIVVSGTACNLVTDRLPAGAWLTELGAHLLGDSPRAERVAQLCHPDLDTEFPPLRAVGSIVPHGLPVPLTRFIGRVALMNDVVKVLPDNRLVSLVGAGGVGKSRLAVQIAAQAAAEFGGGVWFVDLGQHDDPGLVPVAVMRALGVPDQPGHDATDTLAQFLLDRHLLLVLDNCEHLVDACAALTVALLGACPQLTILATSREPIRVPGELTWRVPPLSLTDEAIELFIDRARLVRPDFGIAIDDAAAVREICGRLDGLPLGIELAAARVRVMSLAEILDGLRERFRLLTHRVRTGVRSTKTLGASVDWSHELLSEPERVLFRRLAVFRGGFDLDAARAVVGGAGLAHHQVLDQLTLLVDKSLVVAESIGDRTRYRQLETVRHYGMEKLRESGEADAVRTRHRDHYGAMAALLNDPARALDERHIERVEIEYDNLRAAFEWSRDNNEIEPALALTSSLQPVWLTRGRIQEGLAWFDAVLADHDAVRVEQAEQANVSAVVRGRALADKASLDASRSLHNNLDQAQQAVTIAREVGEPALLARALTAYGAIASYQAEAARPYLDEAIAIARALGDKSMLTEALTWQAYAAFYSGDPIAAAAASVEGRDLADAIGDQFRSRSCRWTLGLAQMMRGDLADAIAQFQDVSADADAARDVLFRWGSRLSLGLALAFHGDTGAAEAVANASLAAAADLWWYNEGFSYSVLATTAVAAGDVAAAAEASEAAWERLSLQRELGAAAAQPDN